VRYRQGGRAAKHKVLITPALPITDRGSERYGMAKLVAADGAGSAVEFALVAPLLLALLLGIIQFGTIFFTYNTMSQVGRDTARRMAVGELTTISEAQAHATSLLPAWVQGATIDPTFSAETARVIISVGLAEVSLVDFLGLFSEQEIETVAEMRK
jgi:hypothetical protein